MLEPNRVIVGAGLFGRAGPRLVERLFRPFVRVILMRRRHPQRQQVELEQSLLFGALIGVHLPDRDDLAQDLGGSINCPEKGHAHGQKAEQAASALFFGKDVMLQTYGKDKCRPTIADVLLPDGTNVNGGLVKDGWCRC